MQQQAIFIPPGCWKEYHSPQQNVVLTCNWLKSNILVEKITVKITAVFAAACAVLLSAPGHAVPVEDKVLFSERLAPGDRLTHKERFAMSIKSYLAVEGAPEKLTSARESAQTREYSEEVGIPHRAAQRAYIAPIRLRVLQTKPTTLKKKQWQALKAKRSIWCVPRTEHR